MKKTAIILVFFLFSCAQKKELYSVYLINDFNRLLWDEPEKFAALNNLLKEDKNPKTTLEIGPVFKENFSENEIDNHQALVKAILSVKELTIVAEKSFFQNKNLKTNKELESIILTSNAYLKSKKDFSPLKYFCTEKEERKICSVSLSIKDLSQPEQSFYLGNYRLENPLYEINRLSSKLKKENALNIFILSLEEFSRRKDKGKLSSFIKSLPLKPDILIINSQEQFKPFKLENVWVSMAKNEKEVSKITVYEIPVLNMKRIFFSSLSLNGKQAPISKEIDQIRKEKKEKLSKKMSYAEKDFKISSSPVGEAAVLFSKILNSYISSNFAVFSNSSLKKGVTKGDITVRDIYEMLPKNDNLIYCKIKGRDLKAMFQSMDMQNTSAWPVEIKSEKGNDEIFISSVKLQENKLYRVLMPQSATGKNFSALSFSMEFSVLDRTTMDAAIWYFRTHKKIK